MRFPQTVSPEMADCDFPRFSGDLWHEMQSLFLGANANPRILRSYLAAKLEMLFWKEWLAGEPGFEPGLTESESVGLPLTYSPLPVAAVGRMGTT